MIPGQVHRWLEMQGLGQVVSERSASGGCINQGVHLMTSRGLSFFLKSNRHSPRDMFLREADGLRKLSMPDGPRVPTPFFAGEDFLVMEDLHPSRPVPDYWELFGRQLATLHNYTNHQFGFDHDNYIGSTPQLNHWSSDGYTFFAENRLLFQAKHALKRGLLSLGDVQNTEKLCKQLIDLIPNQPASLIHGDLWSGNAISDAQGLPALIDPAVYYGWAEAELGMTALFGGFSDVFYKAYMEIRVLPPGLWERFPVYNLYHLLNHLNLFGGGYHGQVLSILRRFTNGSPGK